MKTALLTLALAGNAFAGDFSLDIGVHFGVPQREVVVLRERHVPDPEWPVVLAVAQRARVSPAAIVDLRFGRRSWMDIAIHFGLGPDVYYLPVPARSGPPYGKAHGYWKKRPYNDIEIVDAVNVRFLSDYYRVPRADVIAYRDRGYDFVRVRHEIESKGNDRENHGKGKGKGKGHKGD